MGQHRSRSLTDSFALVTSALLFCALAASASPPPWTTPEAIHGHWTEILEGPVTLQVRQGEGIEIRYQDAERQRTFMLQVAGSIPEGLPDHLDKARLLIRQKTLILTDLEGSRAFILGLSDALGDEELATLQAELARAAIPEDRVFVYTGFGLGQHLKPADPLESKHRPWS